MSETTERRMHKATRMMIGISLGLIFSSPFWLIPPIWQAGFFTPVAFVAYGLMAFAILITEALHELIATHPGGR